MRLFNLLIVCLLMAGSTNAQTYTYKPMGFDTSCFWASEYYFYDGGYYCRGERLSMVAGDTVIGGNRFYQILTYTTAFTGTSDAFPQFCYAELNASAVQYLREDTIARKVYNNAGAVVLDFNLAIGDTMIRNTNSRMPIRLDSISIINVNGVDRRFQWGHGMAAGFPYQSIEGVGANYNFPVSKFGEWDIPTYRLRCFSKGGQTLYSNGSLPACTKKPPVTVSVAKAPVLQPSSIAVGDNELRVIDAHLLPVQADIYDMLGRRQRSYTITSGAGIPLGLIPGSYILRLHKEAQSTAMRIQVQ
jgi:hypothetical protein